jgi:hypothetical protein
MLRSLPHQGRVYFIAAASRGDLDAWLRALRLAGCDITRDMAVSRSVFYECHALDASALSGGGGSGGGGGGSDDDDDDTSMSSASAAPAPRTVLGPSVRSASHVFMGPPV